MTGGSARFSGRNSGLGQLFVVFWLSLCMVSGIATPARAGEDAYAALMAHKSDQESQLTAAGAPCKNANVLARLAWLNEDVSLADAAIKWLGAEMNKDERARDRLIMSYEHGGSTYEGNGVFGLPYNEAQHRPGETIGVPRVAELEGKIRDMGKKMSQVEDRRQADLDEIDALSKKPPCVESPPPPPPPPPPKPPEGGKAATPSTAPQTGGTPTHRTTSCKECQKAVDELNAASDKLLADQGAPAVTKAQLDADQADIKAKSEALDACEKKCHKRGGLLDHFSIGIGVGIGAGHDEHDQHDHPTGSDKP